MRELLRLGVLMGCCVSASGVLAQTGISVVGKGAQRARSFAVVVRGSVLSVEGDWHDDSRLRQYAQAHPGSYIVFAQEGALHRLDTPARVEEAERLYAPMIPLAAKQRALGEVQRPLGEQQQAFAAQQEATGDPAQKGRIGAAQGAVGREQGFIGRQQGEIGRQQGEVGRRYYDGVQEMLDACLKDGTCPRVEAGTAQP